jgi:hypothetical protein
MKSQVTPGKAAGLTVGLLLLTREGDKIGDRAMDHNKRTLTLPK